MLPTRGWGTYENTLRKLGERRSGPSEGSPFLTALGLVASGQLTQRGARYFQAGFIMRDREGAGAVLREALLDFGPAAVLCQVLHGVAKADRSVAETVLRSQGFGDGISDRSLGALLVLMDRAQLIAYNKGSGRIDVLVDVADTPIPSSVYVTPTTPFSNKAWLKRILAQCDEYIYWLDKHFMPIAFEAIAEVADGNRIGAIRILSLHLPDHDGQSVRSSYNDLRLELSQRGVDLVWNVIDSRSIRDTHDRWILGGSTAWNVPNVNAIYSGQHSELHRSDRQSELAALFLDYWRNSQPLFPGQRT